MRLHIPSFVRSKRKFADELEDCTRPVVNALAHLYLFPKSKYDSQWRQEVHIWLHEVKRVGFAQKYPSAKFIYNNTWRINQEDVSAYIQWAIYPEDNLTRVCSYSEEQFTRIVTSYFQWISKVLSENGQVPPKQIYEKLDELGL